MHIVGKVLARCGAHADYKSPIRCFDQNDSFGSTQADRYLSKLMQTTGRINGAGGHLASAAGERPGSRELEALSHPRAPENRSAGAGQ
jgi:hypothetical protein